MISNRQRFDDLDDDIEGDVEDNFDGFESADNDTQKKPVAATGFLADDWLRGLAQGLDPGTKEEQHLWTPQPGPQTGAFNSKADELFYGGSAGGGKLLNTNTDIPTISGYKKMGDIVAGDILFDENGMPTTVLIAHPVEEKTDSYRLEFDDGSVIYADARHQWLTYDADKPDQSKGSVVTTKDIADALGISGGKPVHAVPVSKALVTYKSLFLPLTPYNLGSQVGCNCKPRDKFSTTYDIIPPIYLRSSIDHRLELLRGIMDCVGDVDKFGFPVFKSRDKLVTDQVYELIVSLGWKAKMVECEPILESGESFIVTWKPDEYVFLKSISKDKQNLYTGLDAKFRYIVSCTSVDSMPMRCLTVDSPSHLFLAGESMTPTHNCLTSDHEVLTKQDGWKPITSISVNEEVASMGDNNNMLWQVVTETITEPYKGYLYTYDDDNISFRATPNHKLVVYNGRSPSLIPLRVVSQADIPINLYNESRGLVRLDVDVLNREFYSGDVFCLNVPPYHNFFVRREGKVHVTGNSDLMLGLSLSDLSPHKKAIIFRRSYPELKDIVIRAKEILTNTEAVFRGGNAMRFDKLPYGKTLELGSVPTFAAAQKYKGRPHDLKLFDELSDIGESAYTFLIGWARTADPGVPVRVVAAGNPPTNSEGEWVVRRWGPWLDKNHSNPAVPGELRWFATLDGDDKEITPEFNEAGSRGEVFEYINKRGEAEQIKPKSRTFIPARLDDNAYLRDTDYKSILQNMPEPYRSQLLYGDFTSSQRDDPWQVIPTEWVRDAQQRWLEASENGELQKNERDSAAFGVDVAEGGTDYTVFTMLTGKYLQWIEYVKEEDTMKQVELLIQKMKMNKRSPIGVDAIGVGLGMSQRLAQLGFSVAAIKVSRESRVKDNTGNFNFANLRSELWWRLREAFDPDGDIQLSIPPDKRLFGDLIAPRYTVVGNGIIRVERQDQIRSKIGRSPDAANSLMMALYVHKKRGTPLRMA